MPKKTNTVRNYLFFLSKFSTSMKNIIGKNANISICVFYYTILFLDALDVFLFHCLFPPISRFAESEKLFFCV
jgi:hypothetical protein